MTHSKKSAETSSPNRLTGDFGMAESGHVPVSVIHAGEFSYIDPTHPGHDYFSDPAPARPAGDGMVARLIKKLTR